MLKTINLLPKIKEAFFRFPIALVFFLFLTILVQYHYGFNSDVYLNLFGTLLLGGILFVNIKLFIESYVQNKYLQNLIILSGIILLGLYYWIIYNNSFDLEIIRFILLYISLIIMLPIIVMVKEKDYHHQLWVNIVLITKNLSITFLFTWLIYLGVIGAVATINHLFNLKLSHEIYSRIWILFVGIYAPVLFLAYFPKKEELEKELKIDKYYDLFLQFILFPLAIIYFIILYIYFISVIINWSWPKGIISYLVIGYSVVGIITNLLIIKYKEKNKIYSFYYKYTFLIIIPLIVMLFLAIGMRINEYGFSENRYFVLVFGITLLFGSAVNLFNKIKNYKIIFLTIAIIALLISFGPWSYFNVSMESQSQRFIKALKKHQVLISQEIRPANIKNMSYAEKVEIKKILLYLKENEAISYLNKHIHTKQKISFEYLNNILQLKNIDLYRRNTDDFYYDYQPYYEINPKMKEYDYISLLNSDQTTININQELTIRRNYNAYIIEENALNLVELDLSQIVNNFKTKYGYQTPKKINYQDIFYEYETVKIKAMFIINKIAGTIKKEKNDEKIVIEDFQGILLLKLLK